MAGRKRPFTCTRWGCFRTGSEGSRPCSMQMLPKSAGPLWTESLDHLCRRAWAKRWVPFPKRHALFSPSSATFECTHIRKPEVRTGVWISLLETGLLLERMDLIRCRILGRENMCSGEAAAHIFSFFTAVQGPVRPTRNTDILSRQASPLYCPNFCPNLSRKPFDPALARRYNRCGFSSRACA